jgi:sporulation protein YlmC with PRC-barrel domain
MTTPSGHTSAILASRVKGTTVYNTAGEKIGHVEDVVLDKESNRIMFAALGFGGFLGMGEKFHPIPWSLLSYSKEKGGYVVPMAMEVLKNAPVSELKDLTQNDGQYGDVREKSYNYYKVTKDW